MNIGLILVIIALAAFVAPFVYSFYLSRKMDKWHDGKNTKINKE